MQVPIRVLFLSDGNAARSQMAETLLRSLGGEDFDASSAGLDPSHCTRWPSRRWRRSAKATAPEFAGQQMRMTDWYVRLEGYTPVALVNETHALLKFDAEGRVDWAASPSFHPHRDSANLASESASLPGPQARKRMQEFVFGVRPVE